MTTPTVEKHSFQAEVKQVLDIVINSLYTDKDIFVRELISNASDASEKLRHTQLTEPKIHSPELPLEIAVTTNEEEGTLIIEDHGIGMTHLELVENLGTIAHSGSKAFIKAMEENGSASENLIGQFGVGFYSVFMVAESVEVQTQSWDAGAEGCVWKSDGSNSYTIEVMSGLQRGSKMIIKLKDEYKEFASPDRIRSILEHYSGFVQFPVMLNGERTNTVDAIWLKSKNEIEKEQYEEFYKFQSKAMEAPMDWLHFNADAPLAINALLFIPGENMERFGFSRMEPSVSLYCKKVLIDSQPKGLLPDWLRFAKGVVDSADIPLNISRESMQDSSLIQKLNKVITRRFIKHLEGMAKNKPDDYKAFWEKFNAFIREGITMDFANREHLSKLLRFESSLTEKGTLTSLEDYVSRMPSEQKEIYFIVGSSRDAIEQGPYLEAFKARNFEVIYFYESADDFVMTHLGQYAEKKLTSIEQAGIELDPIAKDEAGSLSKEATEELTSWMQEILASRNVKSVSVGGRLVDSPAMALNADKMMTPNMRRMMQAMQSEEAPKALEVNLEINPSHALIVQLASIKQDNIELAEMIAGQILDNALVSGGLLEDAQSMVNRNYALLEKLSLIESKA